MLDRLIDRIKCLLEEPVKTIVDRPLTKEEDDALDEMVGRVVLNEGLSEHYFYSHFYPTSDNSKEIYKNLRELGFLESPKKENIYWITEKARKYYSNRHS